VLIFTCSEAKVCLVQQTMLPTISPRPPIWPKDDAQQVYKHKIYIILASVLSHQPFRFRVFPKLEMRGGFYVNYLTVLTAKFLLC